MISIYYRHINLKASELELIILIFVRTKLCDYDLKLKQILIIFSLLGTCAATNVCMEQPTCACAVTNVCMQQLTCASAVTVVIFSLYSICIPLGIEGAYLGD